MSWQIIDGLASTVEQVEFFVSDSCNAGRPNGEGATLIGAVRVGTDGHGNAGRTEVFEALTKPGQVVTATATLTPVTKGSTSEFSTCTAVVGS